ncbi:Holliday junction branch migration protein RuvA, partial [Bacteroides heparinolyticus]
LYVVEAIREDAHLLYGFADKHERELFLALVSVSGVGAGTARMILSSLGAGELEAAIASGNVNLLKGVKGIGMKTAQRIIVDLKDKIKVESSLTSVGTTAVVANANADEAVSALVMLGFTQAASQKAVATIAKQMPNATIEQVIKAALKVL